jgi:hypothetical protein
MSSSQPNTLRNAALAILGAILLVLKGKYHGPAEELVWAHGGNFVVSFALYFAAINAVWKYPRNWLLAAVLTLLTVELFEAFDGFGFMTNVYDQRDYLANAAGVAVAVLVDQITRARTQ